MQICYANMQISDMFHEAEGSIPLGLSLTQSLWWIMLTEITSNRGNMTRAHQEWEMWLDGMYFFASEKNHLTISTGSSLILICYGNNKDTM